MGIKRSEKWKPWELENGELKWSRPADLVSRKPIDPDQEEYREFLLTLALIFNDIKGLLIIYDSMRALYQAPVSKPSVSGHRGELEGISVQLYTLLLGTLHEVLVFMHKSRTAYESPYIQRLLRATSKKTRLIWDVINKVANEEPISNPRLSSLKELSTFLVRARNNVSFHYQTHRLLLGGYRKFFFSGISTVPQVYREGAFFSMQSNSFDVSRYYYADAALQGYYINLFGDEKLAKQRGDEALRLASLVVNAINELLIQYHNEIPFKS